MKTNCESCMNYAYDDEYDEYYCIIDMDEDECYSLMSGSHAICPYYRRGDDYTIVRKQI